MQDLGLLREVALCCSRAGQDSALSMKWPSVVVLVSMSSSRRAVPQAAHFGNGSPGATAFSSRFIFGLVMCFIMKVA